MKHNFLKLLKFILKKFNFILTTILLNVAYFKFEIDFYMHEIYNKLQIIFIIIFIIVFIMRVKYISKYTHDTNDWSPLVTLDLKLKFIFIKSKNLIKFFEIIKINLKKLNLYIITYKLYNIKYVVKNIFKRNILEFLWKPLFKRFSYFGNYKNSRSKFIKY